MLFTTDNISFYSYRNCLYLTIVQIKTQSIRHNKQFCPTCIFSEQNYRI